MLNSGDIIRTPLSAAEFTRLSLEIFHYQARENKVYRSWLRHIGKKPEEVKTAEEIPFLPITLFKSQTVLSGEAHGDELVFTSSSTTSQIPSRHVVSDPQLYEKSFRMCFDYFYGPVKDYCFLALLPNYLRRGGSSLVYMCKQLIEASGHELSGFFLDDKEELLRRIEQLRKSKQKTLLIGVSYALIDLCDLQPQLGEHCIVMETGGMKGRRAEWTKKQLHEYLKKGFGTESIHSEYGMTELLSQAYSKGGNQFQCPPWMRVFIREIEDPFRLQRTGRSGGINVIDLANLNSCSFIATQDIGRLEESGNFQWLGRFDNSDVRGCNLMYDSEN